jgi:hypothetical protein
MQVTSSGTYTCRYRSDFEILDTGQTCGLPAQFTGNLQVGPEPADAGVGQGHWQCCGRQEMW